MIPNGIAVETEQNTYYIKGNKKFRVFSSNVLRSWRFNLAPSEENKLKNYKDAGVLGFRPGSLISNQADGTLYIIDGNHKRQVKNPQTIKTLGLEGLPVYKASDAECDLHPTGEAYE